MLSNRKWFWLVIGLLIIVAVVVGRLRPFAEEPIYHGRTVTEWLDEMALFDGPRHEDVNGWSYKLPDSPVVIRNDPALRALLALGSKAVPTLEKTLGQPSEMRMEGPTPGSLGPVVFSTILDARKEAAGLALLALGTNHQAGALRLIELTAAAPVRFSGGPDWGVLDSFYVAGVGLPQQHDEIVAGILAGLTQTNLARQLVAIAATRHIPKSLPLWKAPLFRLAEDADPQVHASALWALACLDPKDSAVMALCEKNLRDQTNPVRLRSFAAEGLGMAGAKATNDLPLLREVSAETNIPKGSGLSGSVARAIRFIEKAAASTNAGSN